MTKKFKASIIKKQTQTIDVPVIYDDGRETEFLSLSTPKTKEVINIRKRISLLVRDLNKDTQTKDINLDTIEALDLVATLSLMACVKAHNSEDDPELKDLTEDDWLAFVYETGGPFSDMALAAAKLCGFHEVAKAGKEVQNKVEELKPDFVPETDNPPV